MEFVDVTLLGELVSELHTLVSKYYTHCVVDSRVTEKETKFLLDKGSKIDCFSINVIPTFIQKLV